MASASAAVVTLVAAVTLAAAKASKLVRSVTMPTKLSTFRGSECSFVRPKWK